MTIFEALKSHDLPALLRERGVQIDGQSNAFAPWRTERTASVHIYADHWQDYGDTNKHGDFIDWLEVAEGLNRSQAVEEAKRVISYTEHTERLPNVHRAPQRAAEPTGAPSWVADLVEQAHEALKRQESAQAQAAHRYLEERAIMTLIDGLRLGVIDESVKVPQAGGKLKGLQGRVIIPTLEDGQAMWFKARHLGDETELKEQGIAKYDSPSGSLPAPFNPVALEHAVTQKFLVLTEGEIDAASLLAAYGLDYPVMGLSGGIPKGWAERIAEAGVPCYLVMDPDDSGRRHAERYRAQLSGLGARCYVVNLPGTQDLNEILMGNGPDWLMLQMETALETAALESTSDLLYVRETWLAEMDARARRPHNHYSTGLPALDKLLDGGYLEGLHLIGGITGGGKTSFALHVALHNALQGRPVIYASYEQSRLELWGRIATRLTGVPFRAIKRGTYNELGQEVLTSSQLKSSEQWDQLEQASKHLKIVEGGDALSRQASAYTIEVLTDTARSIADERGMAPLIILDYLQRVPTPPDIKIRDPRERVGFISGMLQVSLARELQAPVLALSSIGREHYDLQSIQRASIEKRLSMFKEAGEVEYTAYTAMLLYGLADELQGEHGLAPGIMADFRPMTLDLVKNREGDVGQVGVKWLAARGEWSGDVSLGGRRRR